MHEEFPGKLLAYNCSPSFNWKAALDDDTIAQFQEELAAMGYRFQFITLAGFHALNHSMFDLAHDYARNGMSAYVDLQEAEFAAVEDGYTAVEHQAEVGTGYFDAVATALNPTAARPRWPARPRPSSSARRPTSDRDDDTTRSTAIELTGPVRRDRFDEILTPEALAFVVRPAPTLRRTPRCGLLQARRERRQRHRGWARPVGSSPETARHPQGHSLAGRRAGAGPRSTARRDHRARRAQDGHQRPQLRRRRLDGRPRGRHRRPRWRNIIGSQLTLMRRPRPDGRLHRRRTAASTASASTVPDDHRPAARLAPAREARAASTAARSRRSLFDFGLYVFHCARVSSARGAARTSTCPSSRATSRRGCGTTSSCTRRSPWAFPRGTIRATVLVETIHAAFEMDEILYELREHSSGLNAGRWDYIFSVIKAFAERGPRYVLPDRSRHLDDGSVHAGLHRAARADLPQARRACDRRDGRLRARPPRPRGDRASR